MVCNPETLRKVPLFALLDDDEIAVLASQVDLQTFAPRQRIYKAGEGGGRGHIVVPGGVRGTTVDEDQQEVGGEEAVVGVFLGCASRLSKAPREPAGWAAGEPFAIEGAPRDFMGLRERKPHAGMD